MTHQAGNAGAAQARAAQAGNAGAADAAAAPSAPAVPVVGMVGAGQLARMTCQAAISLGIGFRVLAADAADSAAQVCAGTELGDYHSGAALMAFAAGCDVVTFDHEQVPAAQLAALERAGVAIRPGARALRLTQDKRAMREWLTGLGIPCPPFAPVASAAEIAVFAAAHGWPVVLKAVSGGYDGRGVWVCGTAAEAAEVLARAGQRGLDLLAERYVAFSCELAALVARSPAARAPPIRSCGPCSGTGSAARSSRLPPGCQLPATRRRSGWRCPSPPS